MPMKGEINMLNLASVLEVATPKELETVKKHIENNAEISFENMTDAWHDDKAREICVLHMLSVVGITTMRANGGN